MTITRLIRAPVAVLALALVVGACGGNPTGESAADDVQVAVDPALAGQVPQDIRERGTLVVATNAPYPPLEYFAEDNRTLVGFDIDLGNALGRTLDLDVEWRNAAFDSIIPGLQAGRYDIAMAGFGIEPERLQTVNFVSYYINGGGFLVPAGSAVRPGDFSDSLCGLRVAVQKGAAQVERVDAANTYCTGAGQRAVEVLQFPDQNQAVLSLASARSDVVVADLAQVEYAAREGQGQFCVSGVYFTPHSLAGIAVPKEAPELNPLLQQAMSALLANGQYARIAERWGVVEGVVDESTVFTEPREVRADEEITVAEPKAGCASS